MKIHAGTSGFSYDEWRGVFYPADLPQAAMLGHYATRLSSVEVNNTFYQMPKAQLLERWRDLVPGEFCFALKAARRITHVQRLKGVEESVRAFFQAARVLGSRLGPVLFQLPPFARKDAGLLREFLAVPPAGARLAFEFRHPSWFDDEIYALLSQRSAALCAGDADEGERSSPPLVATADWGYLRLRAPSYDAPGIGSWSERILSQPWNDAFVYFKHEQLGPSYALQLGAIVRGDPVPELPPAPPALSPASSKKKPKQRAEPEAAQTSTETAPKRRPRAKRK